MKFVFRHHHLATTVELIRITSNLPMRTTSNGAGSILFHQAVDWTISSLSQGTKKARPFERPIKGRLCVHRGDDLPPPRIKIVQNYGFVDGATEKIIQKQIARASAKMIMKKIARTEILAYVCQVHKVFLPTDTVDHNMLTRDQIESNIVRCPDPKYAEKMIDAIDAVRVRRGTVGGAVMCIVRNCPLGFELQRCLTEALMSLPEAVGIEFCGGIADEYELDEFGNRNEVGLSNGEIVSIRIAFKPMSPDAVRQAVPMVEDEVANVLLNIIAEKYRSQNQTQNVC